MKDAIVLSYARALLEVAEERGELDTVEEEIQFLAGLQRGEADFRNLLLNPGIDSAAKRDLLDRVFRDGLTGTTLDFLQVVVAKGRAVYLESIFEEYQALCDEKHNRIHVEVVTAVTLGDERRERLSAALAERLEKTVLLENVVRPEVIGGLVIRFGDLVVDGSVRRQIAALATRIETVRLGSELIHED